MNNKFRQTFHISLAATILAVTILAGNFKGSVALAVAASSMAQALPGNGPSNGQWNVFLPLIINSGPPPVDSSFELIEKALKSGEIDEETALVYKVFAVYLDPRLPARFKGNDSQVQDTLIMGEVSARWSSLSAATQALLAPYRLPPAAPGSWLEQQEKQAVTVQLEAPIEWVTLSRPGGQVKVWYQTRYPGDDALAAQILADTEDKVWPHLTNLMGRAPLGDDKLPNNGGDNRIDIYLVRIGGNGETVPYGPGCAAQSSYILINGAGSHVRGTLTHEFMHAIIWGYTMATGCEYPEYRWLNEATATWSEDYISPWYDTANSEHEDAPAFLGYPEIPLESRGDDFEYGAYLWPFYLARTFQPELIRTIWDATYSKLSLAAIDGAIPGGFLQQWPEFVKLNLNREPVNQYQQWDGLVHQADFTRSEEAELYSENEMKFPLKATVNHLAAHTYRFKFTDPRVSKVRFENGDRFFSGAEPRAKVEALIKIEGQGWTTEDWTSLPERKFCRTKPGERLEELIIIFSNSEWQNWLDVLDPGTPAPTLWINNQPCSCEQLGSVQNWTGQVEFSFTTSATSGEDSISFNHSATVNLQMGPNYQTNNYVAWQDVSLGGTGEVNDTYVDAPSRTETLIGGGALYPGGPTQDDPSASLGVYLPTCTFEFHLQTGMPATHTIHTPYSEESFTVSTGVGFMDINDIPMAQLTGSRTVAAIWYPYGDEPSWYVPGSVFDGDLERMVGNNFGQATVSWSFTPTK